MDVRGNWNVDSINQMREIDPLNLGQVKIERKLLILALRQTATQILRSLYKDLDQ